jgi:hypothetical protein
MAGEQKPGRSPERKELDRLLDIRDAIENIQGRPRSGEGKTIWRGTGPNLFFLTQSQSR